MTSYNQYMHYIHKVLKYYLEPNLEVLIVAGTPYTKPAYLRPELPQGGSSGWPSDRKLITRDHAYHGSASLSDIQASSERIEFAFQDLVGGSIRHKQVIHRAWASAKALVPPA